MLEREQSVDVKPNLDNPLKRRLFELVATERSARVRSLVNTIRESGDPSDQSDIISKLEELRADQLLDRNDLLSKISNDMPEFHVYYVTAEGLAALRNLRAGKL